MDRAYSAPLFFSVLFSIARVTHGAAAFAQGNLAIVFDVKNGRSSEAHPQTAHLTDLWCQATPDGEKLLPIKTARFVHYQPHKVHSGEVTENRAYLRFGTMPVTAAGKYKCEITTESDEYVHGNLFVYLRPVFHTNGTQIKQLSEETPFEFSGTSQKVIRGERATIVCPAIGFPVPDIQWFKDLQPINKSDDKLITRGKYLYILDADDADEGVYRCIASNSFAPVVDGPKQSFEAILDQPLRITSSLSWLIPLILIVIILILLFIIIYVTRLWKRYKHDQYNVAKKEKSLRNAEAQRLQDQNEDDEE